MSGVLKLEIAESAEELKQLLHRHPHPQVSAKLQVLWWLKSAQASSVNQLAQLSGRHRTTISSWLSGYRKAGLDALLEVHTSPGRPGHPMRYTILPHWVPSAEVSEQLQRELEDPQGFNSYKEVHQWLQAVHGVDVAYKTVHKLVRYRLKAKLKRPRPVSAQQAPSAVEAFQKLLPT